MASVIFFKGVFPPKCSRLVSNLLGADSLLMGLKWPRRMSARVQFIKLRR